MTASAPARPRPRPPALDRGTAYRLAATGFERFLTLIRGLCAFVWSCALA